MKKLLTLLLVAGFLSFTGMTYGQRQTKNQAKTQNQTEVKANVQTQTQQQTQLPVQQRIRKQDGTCASGDPIMKNRQTMQSNRNMNAKPPMRGNSTPPVRKGGRK
jgi:Flp pilus assembly protein TadB